MNVSIYLQTDYENKWQRTLGENKPNSNPNKPNSQKAKMNINSFITKDYRKKDDFAVRKNKPNSNPISEKSKMNVNLYVLKDYRKEMISQSKKTNPIQSQFQNPTQSQRQAFFTHQRSRVDLPLGKSKQTVTSRPTARVYCLLSFEVWICLELRI